MSKPILVSNSKFSPRVLVFRLLPLVGILGLFSCGPVLKLFPSQHFALKNISWEELGEGLILADSSTEKTSLVLLDSAFGINMYDGNGELVHYFNQPGYLQMTTLAAEKGENMNLLFTHSPKSSSLICYEMEVDPPNLVPLVNFSPAGLSHSISYTAKRSAVGDSILLWFSGIDSTLSCWSMKLQDDKKFAFNLESHESIGNQLVDFYHIQGMWKGISSNGDFIAEKDTNNNSIKKRKWHAIEKYGKQNVILINEKRIGILDLEHNSYGEYGLELDSKWKLNRIKYITPSEDHWLIIGEFQDQNSKELVYGAVLTKIILPN